MRYVVPGIRKVESITALETGNDQLLHVIVQRHHHAHHYFLACHLYLLLLLYININTRYTSITQLARLSFNHSIGRTQLTFFNFIPVKDTEYKIRIILIIPYHRAAVPRTHSTKASYIPDPEPRPNKCYNRYHTYVPKTKPQAKTRHPDPRPPHMQTLH